MDLKDFIETVGIIIALVGLLFGLYQYYVNAKWKRSEFAAKQLDLLTSDPDITFCCQVLDYSYRIFPVPKKYRNITNETWFVHEWSKLESAMQPESQQAKFEWPLILYRDAFDRFFTYLERMNHYMSIGIFTRKDISILEYCPAGGSKPPLQPYAAQKVIANVYTGRFALFAHFVFFVVQTPNT